MSAPMYMQPPQPAPKKSNGKLFAILGCAGCAILLLLAGLAVGAFLLLGKPKEAHPDPAPTTVSSSQSPSTEGDDSEPADDPTDVATTPAAPESAEPGVSATTDAASTPATAVETGVIDPTSTSPVSVTYEAEIDGDQGIVTYAGTEPEPQQETNVTGKWTKDVTFADGSEAFSANMNVITVGDATVTCRMKVDGKIIAEETKNGAGAMAICAPALN